MPGRGRPPLLAPTDVLTVHQLSIPAQADALGVSIATVKRQWKQLRDRAIVPPGDPRLPRRGGAHPKVRGQHPGA